MSDSRNANNDPSMDDILASIRKIISDDEARAQAGAQAGGQPARPVGAPQSEPRSEPQKPPSNDDVLLLTNPIEDVKPAANVAAPQLAGNTAAETLLVGAAAIGAATSAFARLNQVVQESVPSPAARDPGPAVSASGKTMEDLVKEMLRPMLKDWLDRNLPGMVERYVEREIVRLTRR